MSRCAIPPLAALLLSVVATAAPVPPQPAPDDSVAATAVQLLQHRKIQKELKMTAEQRIAIVDGLADIEENYDKKLDELGRMPNPPDEAYEKLDKERDKARDKLLADTATKGLSAAQRGRLRQLDWHVRGAAAFTDPQVEKKLQLTDAQKKKAADIAERLQGEVRRFIENEGVEDGTNPRTTLFAFRKDRLKEMVAALTADQKTAWTTMRGDAPTGFVADELWLKLALDLDELPVILGK
jgi:hypothetical protein